MAAGAIRRVLGQTAVLGTSLAGLFIGWSAVAQNVVQNGGQETAPPKLVFDVGTTLSSDSNRNLSNTDPDRGARLDTRFGFAFDSRTRIDQLQISGSSLLRLSSGDTSETGSGVQEPRLRFFYARDTGNARLSATASYTRSDVNLTDTLVLPDGTLASDIARDGIVTDSALGFLLQTGVNDPIGFLLSADASRRDYSQTTDPDVFDSRRQSFGFTTRLTPSPLTQIDLNLRYALTEDDNAAQSRRANSSTSVRLNQALSPLLTLEAELGYSRNSRDSTEMGLPASQTSEGLFGEAGLSLQRPNGNISVTLSSARDSTGTRQTLRFGRSLETSRSGTLNANLGLSARPDGDPQVVGSLRYAESLPTGLIEASLERSVTLDADNEDVTATRLGLTYTHDITSLSRFNLSADFTRSSADAVNPGTTSRRSFRATYSSDLTKDWSLQTGYQYRDLDDDGGRAASNSVFVTIGRRFTAWP